MSIETKQETATGTFSHIKEQILDNVAYFGLMSIILAYLLHSFYTTYQFSRPESAQFPRMVIGFTISIILIDLTLKIYPGLTFGESEPEDEIPTSAMELDMDPRGVVISVLWVIGYIIGMNYIGFFTTTVAFVFLYILVYSDAESLVRRILSAAAWSAGITGFAWVLFVEFLRVSSVFRFGVFL